MISSGAALITGVWYHLAVDKDSSGKIRLYKNGVMMGSATAGRQQYLQRGLSLTLGNEVSISAVSQWMVGSTNFASPKASPGIIPMVRSRRRLQRSREEDRSNAVAG